MDLEQRINNFRKMAEDDPNNELGHFSLGKAYYDAGRYAEAVPSLQQAVTLNTQFTKAFHLLGEAYLHLGHRDKAIDTLRRGFTVAAQRGDMLPKTAMADLLRDLGQELPPEAAPTAHAAEEALSGDLVMCSRLGVKKPRLTKPPFKGALGQKIFERVSAEAWKEWLAMGTKVINELRLDFTNPRHSEIYDQYMKEFLNLQDD
ncbi:MAG: Fe(2+)-trafficking protein [Phycisphaerae bacterium]|nr:Fe(2+)-trafficking protein [Phycisphaerae bacterium]